MSPPPQLAFVEIDASREADEAALFLSRHAWPFHARSSMTLEQARAIKLGPPVQVRSFWIHENGSPAGLIRAFDLDDAERGSVLFDLRIASECRGRGIGRAAIHWLVATLFTEYPSLHRVEAHTRFDNHAMRRALESNKFLLEGRLRETWRSEDGVRHDTALYGRLRSDAS
jgi:RimJ/RimL family protein N-acetyltransferase